MKAILIISSLFITCTLLGQSKREYVYRYAELAVSEMETYKIPASIKLAQGILESRYGLSELSTSSNNHFGIKCHKNWSGKKVYHDDDAKGECFRKYKSVSQSYRDHSEFLSSRSRYQTLFQLPSHDYKGWAHGLKKAGYATNPKYAHHLIKLIEEEKLYVFDQMRSNQVRSYIVELQKADRIAGQPTVIQASLPKHPKVVIGGPAGAEESFGNSEFLVNDSKSVYFLANDNPQSIAKRTGVSEKKLNKYNEWDKYLSEAKPGHVVYLQPKRNKTRNRNTLYHKVASGETMYYIAQQYGIKTEKLYKINQMNEPEQPAVDELISLRKKRETSPRLRSSQSMTQYTKTEPVKKPVVESKKQSNTTAEIEQLKKEKEKQEREIAKLKEENEKLKNKTSKPVVQAEKKKESDPITRTEQTKSGGSTPPNAEIISVETTDPFIKGKNETNTNEEQAAGRAIIYDNTPEINKKSVETYEPPIVKQPTTPSGNVTYHTVSKGDTLYGISRTYGVSVDQIKQWNKLNDSTIKIGQKLIVKP